MAYKYGDTIRLKDGVMPHMSLDKETFFNLPDEGDDNNNWCDNGNGYKDKTYWGLLESAFETDDMGFVYLKSEYAKRFVWGVDDVTRVHDDFGGVKYDRLNINVAFDPEGVVSCGAFCSFVDDCDIDDCDIDDCDIDDEEYDHIKRIGRIRADALSETEEIEGMDTGALFDEFVLLIVNGACHDSRRVVSMKREILRRIGKGDHS